MTREEELWAAIIAALNGDDVDVPVPAWRREEFLIGILGAIKGVEGATVPEPVWREEQYLKAMFDAISEGGGGSSYQLLGTAEFEASTTSTSESSVGTFKVDGAYTKDKIIYVRVRDKAGVTAGKWLGCDAFFLNNYAANEATSSLAFTTGLLATTFKASNGNFISGATKCGVYPTQIAADGTITMKKKYNSSYGTIDGTYVVEVYALDWPDKVSPFVMVS